MDDFYTEQQLAVIKLIQRSCRRRGMTEEEVKDYILQVELNAATKMARRG